MRGFMTACTTGTRRRSVSPWGRRSARWPPRSTCGARLLLKCPEGACPREPINMNTVEGIGYLAASLVLATFCMKSMNALRLAAIASNMAFIAYGYFGHLAPVLLLHALLLPINIYRLVEPVSPHALKCPKRGGQTRKNSDHRGCRRHSPANELQRYSMEELVFEREAAAEYDRAFSHVTRYF